MRDGIDEKGTENGEKERQKRKRERGDPVTALAVAWALLLSESWNRTEGVDKRKGGTAREELISEKKQRKNRSPGTVLSPLIRLGS